MLSPEVLQRMIAAEFQRVGASPQSWEQNFPDAVVRDFAQDPTSGYAISSEGAGRQLSDLNATPAFATGSTTLVCPPGTVKEWNAVLGLWQCTAVGGRVADPEGELYPPPGGVKANPQLSGALPPFVGGRLGRVLFTPIPNRNLNGIRYGTLPRVVMGDVAPGSYGLQAGWAAAAGGEGNIEP